MAVHTAISWCHHTFNGWIGCSRVSEGCRNCYAENLSLKYGWAKWGVKEPRHITTDATWRKPIKWDREAAKAGEPRRVFCSSLADVFDAHPDLVEPRKRLFQLIKHASHLQWLLLTKRPENIKAMLPDDWGPDGYANVWLGTSVENNKVVQRIDDLRAIPAVIRFISYEPALGPIDEADFSGIDWIICGGESGRDHRTMEDDWARAVRHRCKNENIAFFFKQYHGKKSGTRPTLDGEEHHNFPKPRILKRAA